MRNRERIRPFLDKLEEVWEDYPDLRFGQLIINIVPNHNILWNCEEYEFLEMLNTFRKGQDVNQFDALWNKQNN
ncbi:hypothetical protein [Butyrivibrio fibrisolvens]|uniref:hypothetical protein n=1 Tax=Butyrivibrio fibrisolvens TaxID=831 RepID=UPI0003B30295|nr:hypothetical protein [Butyrivibrio fibrisolvens]